MKHGHAFAENQRRFGKKLFVFTIPQPAANDNDDALLPPSLMYKVPQPSKFCLGIFTYKRFYFILYNDFGSTFILAKSL